MFVVTHKVVNSVFLVQEASWQANRPMHARQENVCFPMKLMANA
jgi:hypothetical protein